MTGTDRGASVLLCGRYYPSSLPALRCSKPAGHTDVPLHDWCLFDASHPINQPSPNGDSGAATNVASGPT